jgi:heme o synthase
MIDTPFIRLNQNLLEVCKSYYQLTKPRIIPLLLITTAASMWIASDGKVDPIKLLLTLVGGTLAAASAQTLNCIYDRDIDYTMERTRSRPIPSGRVQPLHALIFALVLGLASFSILTLWVNLLSALLSMTGIIFYMLIYTHLLKRNTTQNIVIGGAAGSIPPLVGWAAVTGDLSSAAWLLFLFIFLWTPPHFWSLALMLKDDYAQVHVPMLPVVAGEQKTVQGIWFYTLLVVPLSFAFIYPLGVLGPVYGFFAIALGYLFIKKAWQLKQFPTDRTLAKSLFKFSIFYVMLMCTGMVIDSLPMVRSLVAICEQGLKSMV